MMKRLFILPALLACSLVSYSQGCSDAGFCTVGALGPHRADTVTRNGLSMVLTSGIGDENVFVFTPAIQYDRRIAERFALQAKLTANYASGNLGTVSGPGDLYATGVYSSEVHKEGQFSASVTAGLKIPLNRSTLSVEGRDLPMQYQSSLGTTDFIGGLSIANRKWQFSLGWQQPLSGSNENDFVPELWSGPEAAKYPRSRMLKRKGDVLLRTVYTLTNGSRVAANAGVLAIYHLGNDSYKSSTSDMNFITLRGSEGLTLNITGALSWKINEAWSLGFTAGFPVVVRDIRPDGLTRSFVFSPEVKVRF